MNIQVITMKTSGLMFEMRRVIVDLVHNLRNFNHIGHHIGSAKRHFLENQTVLFVYLSIFSTHILNMIVYRSIILNQYSVLSYVAGISI